MFTSVVMLALKWSTVCLGVVLVLQASWALARLAMFGIPASLMARWLVPLADAIQAGHAPDIALLGARSAVRWPYSWRLQRCVRLLHGDAPLPLIDALAAAKLLPRACVPLAHAASDQGPQGLARFLAEVAQVGGTAATGFRRNATPYLATLALFVLVCTFFSFAILPKFQQIFRDLGIPMTHGLVVVDSIRGLFYASLWLLSPVGMALVAIIAGISMHGLWRLRRRRLLGGVLLQGTTAGWDDTRLAHLVTQARPSQATLLSQAGSHGDLPAIMRAAGWSARDPRHLAELLQRHDQRALRRRAWSATVVRLILPILIGIPVGYLCYAIHATLVSVLVRIAETP